MKIKKFKEWLIRHGAEILKPTNEYELIRFSTANGVGIIYTGKRGITCVGEALNAHAAWENNKSWKPLEKNKRTSGKFKNVKIRTLLERDGENCFYCRTPLGEDITIEHLLSINHGGNNHLANLVLAHSNCNNNASHLSIIEKIQLRETF